MSRDVGCLGVVGCLETLGLGRLGFYGVWWYRGVRTRGVRANEDGGVGVCVGLGMW